MRFFDADAETETEDSVVALAAVDVCTSFGSALAAGVVGVAGLPTGEYEGPMSERRTGRKRRPWAAPKTQIPKNCLKKMRRMYDFDVERMSTARKVDTAPCITAASSSSSSSGSASS